MLLMPLGGHRGGRGRAACLVRLSSRKPAGLSSTLRLVSFPKASHPVPKKAVLGLPQAVRPVREAGGAVRAAGWLPREEASVLKEAHCGTAPRGRSASRRGGEGTGGKTAKEDAPEACAPES